MIPRLESSKKWTALPEEFRDKILEVLKEGFVVPAKAGRFSVEGRIYTEEIVVRLGYLANGRLVQVNSEVSLAYDFKKDNVQKMLGICIDAAGSILDAYFTNPDDDFPREWMKYEFEKRELYLQLTTVNTELEKEADRLLGMEPEESLVKGEDEEEDILAVHQMLGTESDPNKKDDGE